MAHIGIDARLTYYRDGGISTYIKGLVKALEAMQTPHEFTVFHSRKAQNSITSQFNHTNLWTPSHHKIERLALSAELAWRGLDIFHSPDFIPPYRAAKHHVITVHDLTFIHYPQYLTAESRAYYSDQIQAACDHADHIFADSQSTKQDIIDLLNISASKITVHPLAAADKFKPLPVERIKPVQQALNLPDHFILHVGTWEPRKNIVGLMQAYKLLLDQLPDAPPVVLVGREGWLFEQSKREIDALNIDDHIIWLSNVTDEQLPSVYNLATVLISPSFYEGFGMPALEAMACGTVPIVSNRSSLPEVTGDVGLLVNPDDNRDIAQALYKALTDDTWRQSQEKLAIEQAKRFTWQRCAEIVLQTYTSLL